MPQNRHKQFEHEGEKLWAVFIPAKSPDIKSFVIQDESLRLPTVDESIILAKELKLEGLNVTFDEMKRQGNGGSATVAFIRVAPLAIAFLWENIQEIPLHETYLVELSKEKIATHRLRPEVVLIRKYQGQSPNDRSTGNESGE